MSTLAPPPPVAPRNLLGEPEALIAEARRHRRRRQRRLFALMLLAVVAAAGGWYAFGGDGGRSATVEAIERSVASSTSNATRLVGYESIRIRAQRLVITEAIWSDPTSGRVKTIVTVNGRISSATQISYKPNKTARAVDLSVSRTITYSNRSWTTSASDVTQAVVAVNLAQQVANLFPQGDRFRLLGDQTVNGQKTFHLESLVDRSAPACPTRPRAGSTSGSIARTISRYAKRQSVPEQSKRSTSTGSRAPPRTSPTSGSPSLPATRVREACT